MNTVGKPARLGDSIRCVVSVSMLTEGGDANTVTHVLGVRAFGTQLLCEQVVGRALRRQSYELNEERLFNVEYADVLGIPFDFTAKPVVAPPQKPRETIQVKAVLDPYNPTGSTIHVNFNTSKKDRWETDARRCHINWVILDSDWEAEFCRVAEAHPRVLAYVKNHNLGLEVPYRYGSETRRYLPDFIVLVDDGQGANDPLHLVVEIEGYRGEDAKEKKATMETSWVPGVNRLTGYGRWAFAEFTDVYQLQDDFASRVQQAFDAMIEAVMSRGAEATSLSGEGEHAASQRASNDVR